MLRTEAEKEYLIRAIDALEREMIVVSPDHRILATDRNTAENGAKISLAVTVMISILHSVRPAMTVLPVVCFRMETHSEAFSQKPSGKR